MLVVLLGQSQYLLSEYICGELFGLGFYQVGAVIAVILVQSSHSVG